MKIISQTTNCIGLICISLSGLLLVACQTPQQSSYDTDIIEVSPTQLSHYWVVKDSALDWGTLRDKLPDHNYATVSFDINSQGKIEHIDIDELEDNQQAYEEVIKKLSQQTFYATTSNINARPVRFQAKIFFEQQ